MSHLASASPIASPRRDARCGAQGCPPTVKLPFPLLNPFPNLPSSTQFNVWGCRPAGLVRSEVVKV